MRRVVVGPSSTVPGNSAVVEVATPVTFRIGSQKGVDARQIEIRRDKDAGVPPGSGEVVVTRQLMAAGPPSHGNLSNEHVPSVFGVEPGADAFQWLVSTYGPNVQTPMHSTRTLDLQYVVSGEVALILDEGEVHLEAGDAVIIPGSNHSWRTGAQGCTRVGLIFGTEGRP
jgi:quercetin dioxygenase-like cupin family protein